MIEKVLINRHFEDLNPLILGEEHCLPNHTFGPYVRKYTLIHYVVHGTGTVIKGAETHTVHAGEAFLISPDEIVTYSADANDPWYYQWIGFDGSLSQRFRELPTVIKFPSGIFQELLDIPESNVREYRVASVLYRMYADIFETRKPHNHYVRQVRDYIHALYMQPLHVEEIAQKINLDRRYLSRLFKQKTGQTIQEYLITVRMEEAKNCLEQGASVEKAARLCGYEDVCNFSKMFKRRFGISPFGWKKQRS